MQRDDKHTDRAFVLYFLAAAVLVVLCLLTMRFLQTASGQRLFADAESSTVLVGPGAAKEDVFLPANREGGIVPLGTVQTDSRSRYLFLASLGPGGQVVVVATSPKWSRTEWRCWSSSFSSSCDSVVSIRDGSTEIDIRILNEGRIDRVLHSLSVARISAAYPWLKRFVIAVLVLAPTAFVVSYRRRLWRGLRDPKPAEDLVFAGMVFALCLFVFHRAPVVQINDSRYLTAVSHSFIHGKGLTLPQSFTDGELKLARKKKGRGYQVDRIDGKLLHHYSPLPAVLDSPVVWLFERAGVTPQRPGGFWDFRQEARILRFSAALAAALLCALFYRTARGFLLPVPAVGLALAFAFGTQVLSTLSRPYWAHTWGALLAAAAIHLVLLPWRRHELLSAGLAAFLASLAYYCRPQTFWTPIGLAIVLLMVRSWKRLATLVVVGAVCAGAGALISLSVYGSILPEYFFATEEAQYAMSSGRVNSYRYVTGALGSLVSPGRGLFLYSPLYLWVLYQTVRHWKSLSSRVWAGAALAVITGHLWLIVHTGVWPGGMSYGPRQFSDVLVWFFLLAVLSVEALLERWPRIRLRARVVQTAVFALMLSFSVFTNVRGAFSKATWTWNSYDRPPAWLVEGRQPLMPQHWHWNWRHPQFLAGLLPRDSEEAVGAAQTQD
jgi:hypothetical protein